MAEVELYDEISEWMDGLNEDEWQRTVVVVDRPAALGPQARMPLSRSLGDGLFELRFILGPRPAHHLSAPPAHHLPVHQGRAHRAADHLPTQRNNERHEIERAHTAAEDCARRNP